MSSITSRCKWISSISLLVFATFSSPSSAKLEIPTEPVAKAAYDMLDKHCARCHQDGKLENRKRPAKHFGHVLDLEALAVDTAQIIPGNPDGSPLFQQITGEKMPYDLVSNFEIDLMPTADEITALRTWIEKLGDQKQAKCSTRQFVTNDMIISAIADDIQEHNQHLMDGLRYITLSHLYNSCVSDEAMGIYRQAVVKLLNSLSQNSDVLKLTTIDEDKTIIRFRLDDLKWTPETWDLLISAYPYAVAPDVSLFSFITDKTDTELPFVRGDWLAFAASKPPLYENLLGAPRNLYKLAESLGVDIEANINSGNIKRAGFQNSGVSQNNRLIERHTSRQGYFWTSYDFAGNQGFQSLFDFPLGPSGKNGFQHDGGESVYSLPNGFTAYSLTDTSGDPLDKGPTEIVRDPVRRDQAVTNGISCMSCHDQGIRKAVDDIRKHVLVDNKRGFSKKIRDFVELIYPPVDEMNKILEDDQKKFQSAMRLAGLDSNANLNGVEMINALSVRFEQVLGLQEAAAEFGLTSEQFSEALGTAGSEGLRMKNRLEQGLMPRDSFEPKFVEILPRIADDKVLSLASLAPVQLASIGKINFKARPKEASLDFEIELFADKSTYKVGEAATFTVTPHESCFLTLLNIDQNDTATVLFPNSFASNNFLNAGQSVQFPPKDAEFELQLQDVGVERVIAICSTRKQDTVAGIKTRSLSQVFATARNFTTRQTRAILVKAKKRAKLASLAKTPQQKQQILKQAGITARAAIKIKVVR